ncbi:MAG: cytochrome c oxidase assembly protein, partial [Ilumatobacteraceae bacterium]
MGDAGKMVYLFAQSVIPTVPAGWLTFADRAVYKRYDIPVRVLGIDVVNDQQIAGAIMKVGGTIFMWTIIVYTFIRRFSAGFDEQQTYRRVQTAPPDQTEAEPAALTYEQVT